MQRWVGPGVGWVLVCWLALWLAAARGLASMLMSGGVWPACREGVHWQVVPPGIWVGSSRGAGYRARGAAVIKDP